MAKYRFVHVSDIHFGQEKQNGTMVARDDVRAELLNDCRTREKSVGPADGILVTGDVVFSGKKEEYARAGGWLDELTRAAGCKERTSVFVVPGNHDVDLDGIGCNAEMLHAQLRSETPNAIQARLERLATEYQDDSHPLFRKLREYNNFASGYGCDFESVAKPICQRDYPLDGSNVIRFMGLTSVQVSDRQDAKGKMVLGNAQYAFQRVPKVAHVVMVHHPLEWFKDRSMAEHSIYSRARVAIFGHEHLPRITKFSDQDGGWERIVIDSGAATPSEDEDVYGYTYNWLEFALETKDGVPHLVLTVFPRVWSETRTTFIADHARMTLDGNESAQFSLACHDLSAIPEPEPVTDDQPQVVDAISPIDQKGSEGTGSPVGEQDYRFARLRLLFWRYLDWRQRLNVLVQLDILPNTPDCPMPQTIERLAIERARTERRLHPLWEAMMKFIPENERADNPFAPNE